MDKAWPSTKTVASNRIEHGCFSQPLLASASRLNISVLSWPQIALRTCLACIRFHSTHVASGLFWLQPSSPSCATIRKTRQVGSACVHMDPVQAGIGTVSMAQLDAVMPALGDYLAACEGQRALAADQISSREDILSLCTVHDCAPSS